MSIDSCTLVLCWCKKLVDRPQTLQTHFSNEVYRRKAWFEFLKLLQTNSKKYFHNYILRDPVTCNSQSNFVSSLCTYSGMLCRIASKANLFAKKDTILLVLY